MFEPITLPRVFHLPCGVDFACGFVAGFQARVHGQPPEAAARVRVYLNSGRMRRRVSDAFTASGARFLPRLLLVTDLSRDPVLADLPNPTPALRRRLELAQLIAGLIAAEPGIAPRAALFDLADSLAALMDEMGGEGVSPETLAALDVSRHSAHWARTQTFLSIISPFFAQSPGQDDSARQRIAAQRLAQLWQANPPENPVIVAGSTGSRGATALFMQAVARLPQGAVVLPGFDAGMPPSVWQALDDALTAEDHPQYRFHRLLTDLGMTPADVPQWHHTPAPDLNRNRLISLSLRPAPVTDQWLVEGPNLPDLRQATAGMTLIEASSPRSEALAIALMLRQAAEDGTRAALVTPDRNLTRQVTAALDRFGILPDDSAGRPLALSAPGRLLRHVAGMFGQRMPVDALLVVLKHPLVGTGGDRGTHLRLTRDLELTLRKDGPAFPDAAMLVAWAEARDQGPWALRLIAALDGLDTVGTRPLADHVAHHRAVVEALAAGTGNTPGTLWLEPAGEAALALMTDLAREAPHGGAFAPAEYRALFEAVIAAGEVRDAPLVHPHISILGPREAREMDADLVILGGLTDGTWPRLGTPDPWLNRKMRADAGLLLPERQIGLAAHDYQQAVAAPRVVLTRSLRDAEAETVPSRWLNRLMNLLAGLPDQHGPEAVKDMQARGANWVALAEALDRPTPAMRDDPALARAPRPAPQPPLAARPAKLSLTNIARLIRDPYAIYARYVLRLQPLDPLRQAPDARDRGIVVHDVLKRFVQTRPAAETRAAARTRLMEIAAQTLAEQVPFPAARVLWLAKLDRGVDHFLNEEARWGGVPLVVETKGEIKLDPLPFTMFGTPDRIDRLSDGRLLLIDYKTGTPPPLAEQRAFEKQLIAAAAMATRGGFADLGPAEVAWISYIGLGAAHKSVETQITADLLAEFWAGMLRLIGQYGLRETGYAARRAMFQDRIKGDYDHLARYGEWQMTDRAVAVKVGPDDPA
jgi:inactivated superfamily I helicase/RecB family exonuclease